MFRRRRRSSFRSRRFGFSTHRRTMFRRSAGRHRRFRRFGGRSRRFNRRGRSRIFRLQGEVLKTNTLTTTTSITIPATQNFNFLNSSINGTNAFLGLSTPAGPGLTTEVSMQGIRIKMMGIFINMDVVNLQPATPHSYRVIFWRINRVNASSPSDITAVEQRASPTTDILSDEILTFFNSEPVVTVKRGYNVNYNRYFNIIFDKTYTFSTIKAMHKHRYSVAKGATVQYRSYASGPDQPTSPTGTIAVNNVFGYSVIVVSPLAIVAPAAANIQITTQLNFRWVDN